MKSNRELEQKTFAFNLMLLAWTKFKFYYNIIINTHCWLPVNIYVIENDNVLVPGRENRVVKNLGFLGF